MLNKTLLNPTNLSALGLGWVRNFANARFSNANQQLGLGVFPRPLQPVHLAPADNAGTLPPAALVAIAADDRLSTGGHTTVEFRAVSNRTYTLEYSQQFGSHPWTKLADVLARPTNRTEIVPDPAIRSHRFYRLRTPQKP